MNYILFISAIAVSAIISKIVSRREVKKCNEARKELNRRRTMDFWKSEVRKEMMTG